MESLALADSSLAAISYEDGEFKIELPDQQGELSITSELNLTRESERYTFEILPLVRKDLGESDSKEIFLVAPEERRVGWIIPANALSSKEHAFADNNHFLKYAFPLIRDVLSSHLPLYRNLATEMVGQGATAVPFADLFADNVCFLIICNELAGSDFESKRIVPSLVAEGYLLLSTCDPLEVFWTGAVGDSHSSKIKLREVSSDVPNGDVPARLCSLAATTHNSRVIQFFYFYQVLELLIEDRLYGVLPQLGRSIVASIEAEQFLAIRDQLDGLGSLLSEKSRLKSLVSDLPIGVKQGLMAASAAFLVAVKTEPKGELESLYQVRNFIMHQARNIPDEAGAALGNVVEELAEFLPQLLAQYRRT